MIYEGMTFFYHKIGNFRSPYLYYTSHKELIFCEKTTTNCQLRRNHTNTDEKKLDTFKLI